MNKKEINKLDDFDKKFLLNILNDVNELRKRISNLEALNETNTEIEELKPKQVLKSKIISKPDVYFEFEFLKENVMTGEDIKNSGMKVQSELETILDVYKVKSAIIKYNRHVQ